MDFLTMYDTCFRGHINKQDWLSGWHTIYGYIFKTNDDLKIPLWSTHMSRSEESFNLSADHLNFMAALTLWACAKCCGWLYLSVEMGVGWILKLNLASMYKVSFRCTFGSGGLSFLQCYLCNILGAVKSHSQWQSHPQLILQSNNSHKATARPAAIATATEIVVAKAKGATIHAVAAASGYSRSLAFFQDISWHLFKFPKTICFS